LTARGGRRKIAADDWPGWGSTLLMMAAAVLMALPLAAVKG
jgi:hypothetical protein